MYNYSYDKVILEHLIKCIPENRCDKSLNLSSKQINDEQAKALAEGLKKNTCIESIYLCRSLFRLEAHQAIAESLKTNKTLTSISYDNNNVGSEGGKAIAEALKTNKTLTRIWLNWNTLGPEGGKAIAEALKTNKTLTEIYLEGNNLGLEGGKAIAEALKTNKTLTSITLTFNDLGPEGGKAIADALKTNKTLRRIYLGHNKLGSEGGKAIAEALKTNKTLTEINLEANYLGPEGGKAIAEALKTNKTLTEINLYCNPNLGTACERDIETSCRRNKTIQSIRKKIIPLFQDIRLGSSKEGDTKGATATFNVEAHKSILASCKELEKVGYPKEMIRDLIDEATLARCSWNADDFSERVKILHEIIKRCQDSSLKAKALSLLSQSFFNEAKLRAKGNNKEASEFFLQAYTYGLHSLQEDERTLGNMGMALWQWIDKEGEGSLALNHIQLLNDLLKDDPSKFEKLKTGYCKHCAALELIPKDLIHTSKDSGMGLIATDNAPGKKLIFSAGAGHASTGGQYDAAQEVKVTAEERKHQEEQKATQAQSQAAQSLDEDEASLQAAIAASVADSLSTTSAGKKPA